MKKNIENSDMPISSPTTLAPRRVRSRKIENGTSGSLRRVSIRRTSQQQYRDDQQMIVLGAPQPTLTASTTA